MGDRALKDIFYSHFHRQGSALSLGGILLLVLGGVSACNSTPLSPAASPSPMQTLASAMPSLIATSAPNASPSPLSTTQPSADSFYKPTNGNLMIQKSEIQQGKVYDGNGQLLDDVNIQIRSLNPSVPFHVKTKAVRGEYSFDKAPMGISLEIKAEKQGYASRRKVELISWYSPSNVGKFDFGTEFPLLWSNGSAFYFRLNDQPEVIQVTPSRNGSGVSPKTDFTLLFSEPMDRQSVEDNFTIRSFNSRLLTVDGGPLPYGRIDVPIPHTVKGNGIIASNYQTGQGTPIYERSAFDISWNADNTQVTFSFKDGKALPTDRDQDSVPDYNISFKNFRDENRTIRDKSGIERQEKHFKLTDGDFEESYKFSILPDLISPTLESAKWTGVTPQTASLLLQYSEPMMLKTHSLKIAGGMKDNPASCKQAPAGYPDAQSCISARASQNYSVKVTGANGIPRFEGTLSQLGGKAEYDSQDPTQKTVKLSLAPYLGLNRTHYYAADQILLTDSGRYHTGNFQDNFSFLLDKIDGTQTKVEVSLSANLSSGESLSQDLMVKLNQKLGEIGSSARFTSTFIADPGFPPGLNAPGRISLKLLDAQSDHLGFSALPTPAANSSEDVLPNFQVGGRSLQTGMFLFDFQAGDQLEITAGASIVDPAGNPLAANSPSLSIDVP
ncbi:MAG: Ig-like domain-containing protein [Candidatus Sericytochromatia bacterium]|nr:Ig-like domain-containing protein [Candidatus Sericytochromatia bacterium]